MTGRLKVGLAWPVAAAGVKHTAAPCGLGHGAPAVPAFYRNPAKGLTFFSKSGFPCAAGTEGSVPCPTAPSRDDGLMRALPPRSNSPAPALWLVRCTVVRRCVLEPYCRYTWDFAAFYVRWNRSSRPCLSDWHCGTSPPSGACTRWGMAPFPIEFFGDPHLSPAPLSNRRIRRTTRRHQVNDQMVRSSFPDTRSKQRRR